MMHFNRQNAVAKRLNVNVNVVSVHLSNITVYPYVHVPDQYRIILLALAYVSEQLAQGCYVVAPVPIAKPDRVDRPTL